MRSISNLKNKKGMTLSELLVGAMMLSILLITVGTVFVQMFQLQVRAREFAELNGIIDGVANTIIMDLANASDPAENLVYVSGVDCVNYPLCGGTGGGCAVCTDDTWVPALNSLDTGTNFIEININNQQIRYSVAPGGTLLKTIVGSAIVNEPVFPADFYNGKSVEFRWVRDTSNGTAYFLTITLLSLDNAGVPTGLGVDREYAIRPLTLNQYTP